MELGYSLSETAVQRMQRGGHDSLLVTDNDGHLLRALHQEDAHPAHGR